MGKHMRSIAWLLALALAWSAWAAPVAAAGISGGDAASARREDVVLAGRKISTRVGEIQTHLEEVPGWDGGRKLRMAARVSSWGGIVSQGSVEFYLNGRLLGVGYFDRRYQAHVFIEGVNVEEGEYELVAVFVPGTEGDGRKYEGSRSNPLHLQVPPRPEEGEDEDVSDGDAGSVSGGDAGGDNGSVSGGDAGGNNGSVSGGDAGGNNGSVSGGDAGGNDGGVSGGDAGGNNGGVGGGDAGGNDSNVGGGGEAAPVSGAVRAAAPAVIPGVVSPPVSLAADGKAQARISDAAVSASMESLMEKARSQGKTAAEMELRIDLALPAGAAAVEVEFSEKSLDLLADSGIGRVELAGGPVDLTLNNRALSSIRDQSEGGISLSMAPGTVGARARRVVGDRPVVDLRIVDDADRGISSFGQGRAYIAIPYTLKAGESAGALRGVYVDARGRAVLLQDSVYNSDTGELWISTEHFSLYSIGYSGVDRRIEDIGGHWAEESIEFVLSRGILAKATSKAFAPEQPLTRGALAKALGTMAKIQTQAFGGSRFEDVKASSGLVPYVEWAVQLGLMSAVGEGKFAPDLAVSREEMAKVLAAYAKATQFSLPKVRSQIGFGDMESIGADFREAVLSLAQAGVLMARAGGGFWPQAAPTRGEASAILHRYSRLLMDPSTAQGWARNDAGQLLYYQGGKPLTGVQTLGGVEYSFTSEGLLQTGWVQFLQGWRYYEGRNMSVGWMQMGSGLQQKRYYFDEKGYRVSGSWLQIGRKWYYFYEDGTLARSTVVNDAVVGEDGAKIE